MPAISRGSSVRSRRRQMSEDNIEEEDPTQRSRTEDVEEGDGEEENGEAEEQPRRASKKAKKTTRARSERENGKERSRRRNRDEEEEEEEEKEGDEEVNADMGQEEDMGLAIDIENFQDQPLSKADSSKVTAIASDWQTILRNVQGTAFKVAAEVAVAMAEAGEGKDGELALEELAHMDAAMRELLDTQAEMKAHQDTLEQIANDLVRGEEINNVIERYKGGVEDKKEEWGNKTSRQKYAKDAAYMEFMQNIYEVQHPDQAMPPMTEFIEKEEDDGSESDEIEVGGASQVYTCPITLTTLKEPITSQICKHSFSKNAIMDYFGGNRSTRKRCPAAGCNKLIGITDFQPDKELEKKVKAYERRERQRRAEKEGEADSAEEIID
ncbi:hypothetical protein M0805_008748 [Coniferiporia weirii]|nr:hypothetical protein M0805_008748 [Coniferiporia weirii]